MALIWKKELFLTYFSLFFSYQGRGYKTSFSTNLTHMHSVSEIHIGDVAIATVFDLPILKKIRIYQVWFLFGVIPGVHSYSRHFGTINK